MEDNYLKELIESKGKSSAIYTEYICDHDKYPDKLFCFFEGEDYKYYRTRILQCMDINEDDIFHYDCNGKKEVLKVYEDLFEEKDVKKMFFVDKDFDEDIVREEIFQTECYSIENYYITDSAFKRFLSTEFGVNVSDKNFIKCYNDYIKNREKFNNIITELNAYICYIRKRDLEESERIKLPKEKEILRKFVQIIEVDRVVEDSHRSIKEIKDILNDDKDIDEKEILLLFKNFKTIEKKELFFRGKFEIYFFKRFVTDLVSKIKRREYFEEYEKNINLDINNNIITYLNSYADTTENLKQFLVKRKQAYCKS